MERKKIDPWDYKLAHIPQEPLSDLPGVDKKLVIRLRPIYQNEMLAITEQEIEERGIRERFGWFWFLWCMFRY